LFAAGWRQTIGILIFVPDYLSPFVKKIKVQIEKTICTFSKGKTMSLTG
jgi:hypothetical protein